MRRRLTIVELSGLTFGRSYPNSFALTAHVKGNITPDRVRHALDKVCQKRPFLAGHVVTEGDDYWFETDGTEPIPVISFEGDWCDAVLKHVTIPFDSRKEAQFRVLLGNHAGYSDLALIIDHGIADGLSGAYVLRDLLHSIAHPDEIVVPLEHLPPLEQLLPPITVPQGTEPFDPPQDEQSLAKPRTLFAVPWALSQPETSALVSLCKRHKVSVHSALCTFFLNVCAALDPSGKTLRSVSSPVSVRNRLTRPVGEQVGNFINSGVQISLDCAPGRDLWEMAREFHASMTAASDTTSLLIPIVQFNTMTEAWHQSGVEYDVPESGGTATFDFSLSNLGRLDFPSQYGELELECMYGPILNSFYDETLIGVTTVAGRLTFSLVSRVRLMDYAQALRIRDQFTAMLNKVLSAV